MTLHVINKVLKLVAEGQNPCQKNIPFKKNLSENNFVRRKFFDFVSDYIPQLYFICNHLINCQDNDFFML